MSAKEKWSITRCYWGISIKIHQILFTDLLRKPHEPRKFYKRAATAPMTPAAAPIIITPVEVGAPPVEMAVPPVEALPAAAVGEGPEVIEPVRTPSEEAIASSWLYTLRNMLL